MIKKQQWVAVFIFDLFVNLMYSWWKSKTSPKSTAKALNIGPNCPKCKGSSPFSHRFFQGQAVSFRAICCVLIILNNYLNGGILLFCSRDSMQCLWNPPKNSWVRKINLDLPSRKLTHPTNGSSENHRLTSAQLDGICDRSQKGISRSRNFGNSPKLCYLVDGGNIP